MERAVLGAPAPKRPSPKAPKRRSAAAQSGVMAVRAAVYLRKPSAATVTLTLTLTQAAVYLLKPSAVVARPES